MLENLSLAELFTAADAIPDHRTEAEKAAPQPDRAELIQSGLPAISRPYSPVASQLIAQFQLLLSDAADLEPAEQARLLAALAFQINGQLTKLHG